MHILRRLLGYIRPYRGWTVITYAAMFIAIGLNLAVPWVIRGVIDRGLADQDFRVLVYAGALILGLAAVRSVFSFLQLYGAERLSQSIAYDMRNQLYNKIQRLPFAFHDRTQTGELMSRATSDVEQIMRFTGQGAMDLISIAVLFVATIALMFSVNAQLAAIALLPIPFLVFISLRFGLGMRPLWQKSQEQTAVLSTTLQENLSGIRVVKAFAREQYETDRFHTQHVAYNKVRQDIIAAWSANFPALTLTVAVSTGLILWFGGRMVIDGAMTVGTLVAFNAYLVMLAFPTQRLGFVVDRVAQALASGKRVFDILDTPAEIVEPPDAYDLGTVQGYVTFEHVSFAYRETRDNEEGTVDLHDRGELGLRVLHDVSFEAEPNQIVALMGLTGSGKSSIINLIPRFYDPTAGRVLIDGHDIREVQLESLRRQIGIVLQDTFLFSATARENIAYGRPDATMDEIIAAAKAAGANDFLAGFPDGYETEVGERGVSLSGGQRQRLAIARALLMDPRILILDDATSSVDPATEFEIQQALGRLMHGRTTFVIAQRLLTLKNADQILVLDQGRIVQRGRHEELVRQPGLYRQIYDLQLRDQEETASTDAQGHRVVHASLDLASGYGSRGRRN